MSAEATKSKSEPGIRLVAGPELTALEVRKEDTVREFAPDHQVEFRLNLGLNRLGPNVLGIELSVQITNLPGVTLAVAYRSVIEIDNPPTDPDALTHALRQVGGRVAPSLMYPFIREAVVSSLQRAQLPAFVPPIVNFANVFDLETLAVPGVRGAGCGDQG